MLWVRSGPGDLVFITWSAHSLATGAREDVRHVYSEIGRRLREDDLVVLHERVFGEVASAASIAELRAVALGEGSDNAAIPPTHVEGIPCIGSGAAGIQVIAARPSTVDSSEILEWHGAPCGRRVDGKDASYLSLSDLARLLPSEARSQPADETREALLLADQMLRGCEWSFADVCRTWFFLDDILAWYDDFNRTRNEVFENLRSPQRFARERHPGKHRYPWTQRPWASLHLRSARDAAVGGSDAFSRKATQPPPE